MNLSENITQKPAEDAGIREIFRLLVRRMHILCLAGLCGAAFSYAAVRFLVRPAYQSRVSFYIYNYSESGIGADTVSSSDLMAAEKLTTTYASIMGSNTVLDAVIAHMDAPVELTRNSLRKMTETSVITNTQLLSVTVTSPDAALSYRIAASFAEVVPEEIIRITRVGSVEPVDLPEMAACPSSPDRFRSTCIGAFMAILLAAAVLILRMLADTTIYLPDDVLRMTHAVLLGQIPAIEEDRNMVPWEKTSGGVIRYVRKEEQ